MSECDICAELADIKASLADHGDKLSILLTGVGALVAAIPPAANYWNPLDVGAGVVLSNGNKDAQAYFGVDSGYAVRSVTSHASGKYYAELVLNSENTNDQLGIANATYNVTTAISVGDDSNSIGYYMGDGSIYENNVNGAYGSGAAPGDIVSIAIDMAVSRAYFSINGVWQNSADPAAVTGGYAYSVTGDLFLAHTPSASFSPTTLRTQLSEFTYTPPTGFSAWG